MYKQLTKEQRYTIEVLLKQKQRKKDIAAAIGVSGSTVYREIRRNRGKRGNYTHGLAQELADERKERLPGNRKAPASDGQSIAPAARGAVAAGANIGLDGLRRRADIARNDIQGNPQGQGGGWRPLQELPPPAQAQEASRRGCRPHPR